MRVLVTAATQHGATGEIAGAIGTTLAESGLDVEVRPPDDVDDVSAYDAVVLGSAVYAGHWLGPAKALVHRAAPQLAERPVWLFSSGPVGDPSRKLVQQMGVDPVDLPAVLEATGAREHRVFPGRLVREELPLVQRAGLRLVHGLEGDFRDWPGVQAWALSIADALQREATSH